MKFLVLVLFTNMFFINAYATEVATDCPAMNENREKILKPSSDSKRKQGAEVIGQ